MDFLSGMKWWEISLMLCVSSVAIGVVALFITNAVKKNGINLSLGKAKVSSSGPTNVENNEVDDESHRHCPRWRDIILVVEIVSRIEAKKTRRIDHIRDIEMIRDQMNYAEEKVAHIRKLMRGRFLKLVKDMTNEPDVMHMHITEDYLNILKILSCELLDKFRIIFRENHLSAKSDLEFESYLKVRVPDINNTITEVLDELYPSNVRCIVEAVCGEGIDMPSRVDVYEANKEISEKMLAEIEDCIRHGRIISVEKDREILKLERQAEEESKRRVEAIIG